MNEKKQEYEAPIAEAWVLTLETEFLTISGGKAGRNSYISAESEEWD